MVCKVSSQPCDRYHDFANSLCQFCKSQIEICHLVWQPLYIAACIAKALYCICSINAASGSSVPSSLLE